MEIRQLLQEVAEDGPLVRIQATEEVHIIPISDGRESRHQADTF
jgi:hypothetical protein